MSDDADEFFARAQAIETEAGERYAELADQMEVHNNREVAALFRKMAEIEAKHARNILARAGDRALPKLPLTARLWDEPEGPETTATGDTHYLMTPYHALELALANEERAARYFSRVAAATANAAIRALAVEIAAEEAEHVALIKAWLAKYPKPEADWAEDPDPPIYSE